MRKQLQIGVYPGAFDPIHVGHVAFAKQAIETYQLDKVYFLPEPRPRHKQGVKALSHRVAMISRAVASEPQLGLVDIHDQRFTITETWPKITARFAGAELYMLLGSDVAMRLGSWPDLKEHIATMPIFIIGTRKARRHDIATMLRDLEMVRGIAIPHRVLETLHIGAQSVAIRTRLRKGLAVSELHPNVLQYIQREQLYQPQSTEDDRG